MDDDGGEPTVKTPVSTEQVARKAHGAFGISVQWWTRMSSIAKIIPKGWSWIGQALAPSVYRMATNIICHAEYEACLVQSSADLSLVRHHLS